MFGADLSTAVRVKISTDVQAAGLRVDQKQVSEGCTSFSTNQLTVKTCEDNSPDIKAIVQLKVSLYSLKLHIGYLLFTVRNRTIFFRS